MKVAFSKYHGAGNDFLLIDDRRLCFPCHDYERIEKLCHRRQGVGADGIILYQNSDKADLRMRIFNADGSEAEMCGNGIRCLLHFARLLGFAKEHCMIEAMHSILECRFVGEKVAVDMGVPRFLGEKEGAILFDTGVPHAVVFVSNLAQIDVAGEGGSMRRRWEVNVNFASMAGEQIAVRTYERGVEGETLACGTGAVAVAAAVRRCRGVVGGGAIRILPASGEAIEVLWQKDGRAEMIGPVDHVFDGVIDDYWNS